MSASTIRDETRAMLARLIGFDTTSRNSNLDLIHDVRDYLAGFGVRSELLFNAERTKANLYATLGPDDRGGIALSGHTDVVPVDDQDWSSDPFALAERDGRFYGRGTCDMKGFVAVVLGFVPEFLARDLATPIHLCLSYDEEVGCLGVPGLLDFLKTQPVRPRACVVGEPTDMKVVGAHKGKLSYRCHVRGRACHSSLAPQGVNAVQAAARVVTRLADMADRKAAEGPFDPAFDVPHTTVHTGTIRGGVALNIVPTDCSFEFEFRHLPGDDPQALLQEVQRYAHDQIEPPMQAVAAETGFSWEKMSQIPALDCDPAADIVTLGKALAAVNDCGKVAFGTEAGQFASYDVPAIVCGPGSIEQAHKPDEFVSLEQLALCERFMERLAERAATPDGLPA